MTPAAQARNAAGFTLEQAARRARVCPAYLRRIERYGGASYVLAQRLAFIYGCRIDVFLLGATGCPPSPAAGTAPSRRHKAK